MHQMTAGLISKYNAKPFMCIKTGMYYTAAQYMAIEVDVHRWGKLALNGWSMVKGHVHQMRLRFGLLIQAEGDHEMPEQMLACAYVSRLSSAACPVVPAHVLHEAENGVYGGNSMAC